MKPTIKIKVAILLAVISVVTLSTFTFAVFHQEDGDDSIAFVLTNQFGQKVSHEDLSDRHLLVFFGFTSCEDVCPMGLITLTNLMRKLDEAGEGDSFSPVFITVDPERDSVERIEQYLTGFDANFIGLTGSRTALTQTAMQFNTFLDSPPDHAVASNSAHSQETATHSAVDRIDHKMSEHGADNFIENYQLTHSSMVYVVDTYSRVITHLSLDKNQDTLVSTLRNLLSQTSQPHG